MTYTQPPSNWLSPSYEPDYFDWDAAIKEICDRKLEGNNDPDDWAELYHSIEHTWTDKEILEEYYQRDL